MFLGEALSDSLTHFRTKITVALIFQVLVEVLVAKRRDKFDPYCALSMGVNRRANSYRKPTFKIGVRKIAIFRPDLTP